MSQPNVNNLLPRLQRWYHSQCDGIWEEASGINIETLDNPGWIVEVSLKATKLQNLPFTPIDRAPAHPADKDNWLSCSVHSGKFVGAGGPEKLAELIAIFLDWAGAA